MPSAKFDVRLRHPGYDHSAGATFASMLALMINAVEGDGLINERDVRKYHFHPSLEFRFCPRWGYCSRNGCVAMKEWTAVLKTPDGLVFEVVKADYAVWDEEN